MQQHGPDERKAVSRRRLMGLLGAAGAAGAAGIAGCSQTGMQNAGQAKSGAGPPAARLDGQLAANFNHDPSTVTFRELREIKASWLRGFYTMHEAGNGDPAQQPEISKLTTAAERGYGTLVSLKFQYGGKPIPQPGTREMEEELARVDKVLSSVMNKMDVLVIGNEPFFETRKVDRNEKLNTFYEAIARHVIKYRDEEFGKNCTTHLYMGALNRLDDPAWRTPATKRWMAFVRDTPAIEGVDIHPHVADSAGVQKYLDYVLPKMRPEQKFLATEFSLVLYWEEQLDKPVAPGFAKKYDFPIGTPVWKVVRMAIEKPFPQRQWNDFLAMSPWYQERKHFLRNQVQRFRDTGKLAAAAYGVAQDDAMVKAFGPDSKPWLFNSLFASKTVQSPKDSLPGRNGEWIKDFRSLQREQDQRQVR